MAARAGAGAPTALRCHPAPAHINTMLPGRTLGGGHMLEDGAHCDAEHERDEEAQLREGQPTQRRDLQLPWLRRQREVCTVLGRHGLLHQVLEALQCGTSSLSRNAEQPNRATGSGGGGGGESDGGPGKACGHRLPQIQPRSIGTRGSAACLAAVPLWPRRVGRQTGRCSRVVRVLQIDCTSCGHNVSCPASPCCRHPSAARPLRRLWAQADLSRGHAMLERYSSVMQVACTRACVSRLPRAVAAIPASRGLLMPSLLLAHRAHRLTTRLQFDGGRASSAACPMPPPPPLQARAPAPPPRCPPPPCSRGQ